MLMQAIELKQLTVLVRQLCNLMDYCTCKGVSSARCTCVRAAHLIYSKRVLVESIKYEIID